MRWLPLAAVVLAACPPPARYTITRPDLPCDRATRMAYRTLENLGYAVGEFTPPSPEQPGRIMGTKTGAEGRPVTAGVHITCGGGGAVLQPIEADLFPNWEYSRAFGYSFKSLAQLSDVDVDVPREQMGLEVLVHVVGPYEARLDYGGEATTGGAVGVLVTIRNNTERAVRIDPGRIEMVASDGSSAEPLAGAALEGAIAAGSGGDRVRRAPLGAGAVRPNTTASGWLVYPPGTYTEARAAIEDVETGETEGFLTPVQ
jgi:hypothetical protein